MNGYGRRDDESYVAVSPCLVHDDSLHIAGEHFAYQTQQVRADLCSANLLTGPDGAKAGAFLNEA